MVVFVWTSESNIGWDDGGSVLSLALEFEDVLAVGVAEVDVVEDLLALFHELFVVVEIGGDWVRGEYFFLVGDQVLVLLGTLLTNDLDCLVNQYIIWLRRGGGRRNKKCWRSF